MPQQGRQAALQMFEKRSLREWDSSRNQEAQGEIAERRE